jgi:hypothetical protein
MSAGAPARAWDASITDIGGGNSEEYHKHGLRAGAVVGAASEGEAYWGAGLGAECLKGLSVDRISRPI